MIRKGVLGVTAGLVFHSLTAGPAEAAATGFVVLAQAQPPGVKVTQAGAKNYIAEVLVVVVLIGAALFVICKIEPARVTFTSLLKREIPVRQDLAPFQIRERPIGRPVRESS